MNRWLTRISLYLNVGLLCVIGLLLYQLQVLNGVLDALAPPVSTPQSPITLPAWSQPQPQDTLVSDPTWQNQIRNQVTQAQGQPARNCLFGDSISAGLGQSLGPQTLNLALNSMSTISLAEQLRILTAAGIRCQRVAIAIGTNDAMYGLSDAEFARNLHQILTLAGKTRAEQIMLIPAFYATEAASHNRAIAGTNDRIDQLNQVLEQVAQQTQIPIAHHSTAPLFQHHALNPALTVDGVHLNEAGLARYRLALLEIFSTGCHLT